MGQHADEACIEHSNRALTKMTEKKTLVFDTECYIDYWMIRFLDSGGSTFATFELYEGHPLNIPAIKRIMLSYRVVSFNGKVYDMPMIAYAMSGATCAQLKAASDAIIEQQMRPWDFETAYNVKIPPQCDHIDLIEVAPGQGSLKAYGGRLHAPKLQDLPYAPEDSITPDRRPLLVHYCGNDLTTTDRLFLKLLPQIQLRELMSAEYGQDLRSKSDAQIAEAVIRAEVQKSLGERVFAPKIKPGTSFKYKPPEWLKFRSQVMQAVFADVCSADFVVNAKGKVEIPEVLKKARIAIGKGIYRMGNGGLHSSESGTAHFTDADAFLVDRDVASYYPMIVLLCGLSPEQMGVHFTRVYRAIVERRLEAKAKGQACEAAGDTVGQKHWEGVAQTLKIVINGSFGKLGSKWSSLYSPNLMIQVTVTGQLALLMFIEAMELAGIPVVSANTDGVVMRCPRSHEAAMNEVVAAWESATGFETEATLYRALFSRDVNNYIAIKPDGKYKTKGAYAPAGLQKNPTNTICVDAVAKFLTEGIAVEETILGSTDITKFTTLRTVKGGGMWGEQYLGKMVRWIYTSGQSNPITYRSSGNKVARSDGCRPMMDLPEQMPDDVNYAWYVNEAYEILLDIGRYVRPPKLRATRKKVLAAEPKIEEEVDA